MTKQNRVPLDQPAEITIRITGSPQNRQAIIDAFVSFALKFSEECSENMHGSWGWTLESPPPSDEALDPH